MVNANQTFPHGQAHVQDHVAIGYRAGHGRAEQENQDAYWPRSALQSKRPVPDYLVAGRLYIVADGVSLSTDGRKASYKAADTIGETFYAAFAEENLSEDQADLNEKLQTRLRDAILRADQELVKLGGKTAKFQTTCVAVVICGIHLYVAHVGDSRAYLFRQKELIPLTADHIAGDDKLGLALGIGLEPREVTFRRSPPLKLEAEDIVLLCTDGLYKEISDKRIEGILSHSDNLEVCCQRLMEAVLAAQPDPDKDDVTIMLVAYRPTSSVKEIEQKNAQYNSHTISAAAAVEALEKFVWWMPDHAIVPNARKKGIRMLAEWYEDYHQALRREGRDLSLAQVYSKAAARLGYRPQGKVASLIEEVDAVSQQASQIKANPERQRENLETLLDTIRRGAANQAGSTVWHTLSTMTNSLIEYYWSREDWKNAHKYYLLTKEQVDSNYLDDSSRQAYKELHENHYYHLDHGFSKVWKRAIEFISRWPIPEVSEEVAEEALLITSILSDVASLRSGLYTAYDVCLTNSDVLTIARFALDHLALHLLFRGQDDAAGLLTEKYEHWPEAHAIAQLADGLKKERDMPGYTESVAFQAQLAHSQHVLQATGLAPLLTKRARPSAAPPDKWACYEPIAAAQAPALAQLRLNFANTYWVEAETLRDPFEQWEQIYRAAHWLLNQPTEKNSRRLKLLSWLPFHHQTVHLSGEEIAQRQRELYAQLQIFHHANLPLKLQKLEPKYWLVFFSPLFWLHQERAKIAESKLPSPPSAQPDQTEIMKIRPQQQPGVSR